jgi:hypothetical protein
MQDLQNLPFDPAVEAMKEAQKYNPNEPETEEDGIKAEALRRLKVRQMFKAQPDRTRD